MESKCKCFYECGQRFIRHFYTAVHNDIVPSSELIDKVAKSFMELSKSVGFSHTTIRDFEKEKIDHDDHGITKRQSSGRDVDLTKALIERELVECRVTPEKKMTNIGLLNAECNGLEY